MIAWGGIGLDADGMERLHHQHQRIPATGDDVVTRIVMSMVVVVVG